MSILNGDEIYDLCLNKKLVENYSYSNINAASLDIRLGNNFFIYYGGLLNSSKRPLNLARKEVPPMQPLKKDEGGTITLSNRDFLLAESKESFNLPDNICAEFILSSSLGRCGLEHAMSGFCNPGWRGSVLTLELYNRLMSNDLLLESGMVVGQIVFHKVNPCSNPDFAYSNKGRYSFDKSVMLAKKK